MAACLAPCLAQPADSLQSEQYGLQMQARGQQITGICLMEHGEEGLVGTVVNEFGVKAFDFTYEGGKVKLLNIIEPLDKWYIRRVLRKDFRFIIRHLHDRGQEKVVEKKRSMARLADGNIQFVNHRYKISYIFTPMQTAP